MTTNDDYARAVAAERALTLITAAVEEYVAEQLPPDILASSLLRQAVEIMRRLLGEEGCAQVLRAVADGPVEPGREAH